MDYQTIMNLWMYDFQNILENYSKIVEERRKEEEKQNEEYEKKYNMSPDKYMKQYSPQIPKVPNLNNVKL